MSSEDKNILEINVRAKPKPTPAPIVPPMKKSTLTIEVGKKYVDGMNRVVEIIGLSPSQTKYIGARDGGLKAYYHMDGQYDVWKSHPNPKHLVREYISPECEKWLKGTQYKWKMKEWGDHPSNWMPVVTVNQIAAAFLCKVEDVATHAIASTWVKNTFTNEQSQFKEVV